MADPVAVLYGACQPGRVRRWPCGRWILRRLASYAYDSTTSGNKGIGRRTSMTDGSGSTTWFYDERGRVTSETKAISGPGSFKTQYAYNSADMMTSMTYPGNNSNGAGETVTFGYNRQMALNQMYSSTNNYYYVPTMTYDAAGRVTQRQLGGTSPSNYTLFTGYTYNPWNTDGGRLQSLNSAVYSIPVITRQDLDYTYDNNGNIETIADYAADGGTQTQTFTYDTLDRLTSAVATGGTGGTYTSQNYVYDSTTGNLSSKAGQTLTYGDAAHRHAATAYNGWEYIYDANGNMTHRDPPDANYYDFTYDTENRLIEGKKNGVTIATFTYDGDGNRVKSVVNSVTTAYVGSHFEWTGSTDTMKKYYSAGGTRVGIRVGSSTGQTTGLSWLFGDQLGSTSITLNASGAETGELRYTPWGETRYNTGTTPTTFRYTGQREQSEIGLYFYNARWYDPQLGRFTSADTMTPKSVQGLDRYAYVDNNPIKNIDPTGHCTYSDYCPWKTVVVVACGRDGNTCGKNNDTMKPYYDYAKANGYQVQFFDTDDPKYDPKYQKYDMAKDMAAMINDNPDNEYYLFGHSAGADATILATAEAGYADNIKGVALLDPTMTANIRGQSDTIAFQEKI